MSTQILKWSIILLIYMILLPFFLPPMSSLTSLITQATGLPILISFNLVLIMLSMFLARLRPSIMFRHVQLELQYSWEKSTARRWLEKEDKNWDDMLKRLES